MSRFADPTAAKRMHLGACQCPGTPHTAMCACSATPHAEGDWIAMRTELGVADLETMAQGGSVDSLELLAVEWNLLDKDGSKAPLDRAHLDYLFGATFETIDKWTNENIRTGAVPNAPAAPSRSSSRASGSPTPIRKKAG